MDKEIDVQILELLYTFQEVCVELYDKAQNGDIVQFQQLVRDVFTGLSSILSIADNIETIGYKRLKITCQSLQFSLERIEKLYTADRAYCLRKIKFELLPILQGIYAHFYYFQHLTEHPEKLNQYYQIGRNLLGGNTYTDKAIESGSYRYEVSIVVLAFNKLEYTKQCIKSILANIPKGLNYELILVNHGSNDGTKEYFESVHPYKQQDIAINGGGADSTWRIVEGEFTLFISNDIIVTPHAVENMLACIRSDPQIAWVVPSTPNVSNLQTISARYDTQGELLQFAEQNNSLDPFRWEQRVRLCNPIDLRRNSVFYATSGLCVHNFFHTLHQDYVTSFPDDRISLLLRRNGYKMMLAKDAYCHHFGSVTLKDEIQQHNEQRYYLEGRQEFYKAFGVDPWGTGFCYDPIFCNRVVDDEHNHVEVLGINCGLGSNSLKIKEQIKEYCHNTDCGLTNLTDDVRYLKDLQGISDQVAVTTAIKGFKTAISQHVFQYIVWETPFLEKYKFSTLFDICIEHLDKNGKMLIKLTRQSQKYFKQKDINRTELGSDWILIRKQ